MWCEPVLLLETFQCAPLAGTGSSGESSFPLPEPTADFLKLAISVMVCSVHRGTDNLWDYKAKAKMDTFLLQNHLFLRLGLLINVKFSPPASDFFLA